MAKATRTTEDAILEDLGETKGLIIGLDSAVPYFINTGHYGLNMAVSGRWDGGWAGAKVTEIYGDPQTGKSLLMLEAMESVQQRRITVVEPERVLLDAAFNILQDTESAYTDALSAQRGVDMRRVIRIDQSQNRTVEDHFIAVEETVTKIREKSKKSPILVLCDSISQLTTEHEVKVGMEKKDMSKAGKVHQAMRLYSSFIDDNMLTYLLSSHVIANIGVMYGPDKVVKGGSALAFQSSCRVDLRMRKLFMRNILKTDEAGERGEVYGARTLALVDKNRITAPHKFTVIDIYYEHGIDPYSGLYDYFLRAGRIKDALSAKGTKRAGYFTVAGVDCEAFVPADFPYIVTKHDLLGIKAAGGTYMRPLDLVEDSDAEPISKEEAAQPKRSPRK